jgi:hypothetical protein
MLVDASGNSSDGMVVDSPKAHHRMSPERPIASSSHRPPPPPLSPISNPPSPSRKRPRLLNWQPPSHIPEFLPPFPRIVDVSSPLPFPQASQLPPLPPLPVKVEKPLLPIPSAVTLPSSSDYLTREPYDQSSLASVPEWHLPNAPPIPPAKSSRLTTPQTEPALIAAYHHILTHAPAANASTQNPARHKVVMALLSHAQNNPRWDPPDTLFSSIAPCPPRVAVMTPTFPIPISKTPPAPVENKPVKLEDKDREPRFPPIPGKPVSYIERLSPLVSHQGSRIPDLARSVLSVSIVFGCACELPTRFNPDVRPCTSHSACTPFRIGRKRTKAGLWAGYTCTMEFDVAFAATSSSSNSDPHCHQTQGRATQRHSENNRAFKDITGRDAVRYLGLR